VNVADIPGFWAYSENLKRKRHATSPVWYRTEERGLVGEITFMLTPFMVKLGLEVYNTRPITIVNNKRTVSHLLDTEGAPLVEWNTECVGDYSFLREGSQKMIIHRVAKIESNTSPVFRTRSIGTIEVTPFFIEFYGAGRFLISLVCQSENNPSYSNSQMKGLLADLIVEMLKNRSLGMRSGG